jgi:hypothetical protein
MIIQCHTYSSEILNFVKKIYLLTIVIQFKRFGRLEFYYLVVDPVHFDVQDPWSDSLPFTSSCLFLLQEKCADPDPQHCRIRIILGSRILILINVEAGSASA